VITAAADCPAWRDEAVWNVTVSREATGVAHYVLAYPSCHEVTEHVIDLLRGLVGPWPREGDKDVHRRPD
jgi:hypothetical protein